MLFINTTLNGPCVPHPYLCLNVNADVDQSNTLLARYAHDLIAITVSSEMQIQISIQAKRYHCANR